VGNCNGDSSVTTDELLAMLRLALRGAPPEGCDVSHPQAVDVAEILIAVNHAVAGCPGAPTLPDLVPLGVYPSAFVEPPLLPPWNAVCVANHGGQASGPFHAAIHWDFAYQAPQDQLLAFESIAAAGQRCLNSSGFNYGGVELVVDSQDEVAERDETNNRLTGYVPIP